jgi:hypothetical protein
VALKHKANPQVSTPFPQRITEIAPDRARAALVGFEHTVDSGFDDAVPLTFECVNEHPQAVSSPDQDFGFVLVGHRSPINRSSTPSGNCHHYIGDVFIKSPQPLKELTVIQDQGRGGSRRHLGLLFQTCLLNRVNIWG